MRYVVSQREVWDVQYVVDDCENEEEAKAMAAEVGIKPASRNRIEVDVMDVSMIPPAS